MGWHGRSRAWEVIVIAQGERERGAVVTVFTNGATWRWSCRDGHMMTLNRGGWWCPDGEMVPDARRRDWNRGGWWIMGVLSLCFLLGRRVAESGWSREGRQREWNLNGAGKGRLWGAVVFIEEEGEEVRQFHNAEDGWKRRAVWRLGRPKVVADVLRLKIIKGNWVDGPNALLSQTVDWTNEKIWLRVWDESER
jgi:hypothetical protein